MFIAMLTPPSAQARSSDSRLVESLESRVLMAAHELDPSFGENATGMYTRSYGSATADQYAFAIAQQGDGKLIVAGRGTTSSGEQLASVMRFRPDGTPDNTWGGDGSSSIIFTPTGTNERGDIGVLRNGHVVLAVSAESFDSGAPDPELSRMTLVFFEPDGSRNTIFHTNGIFQPDFGAEAEDVVARAVSLLPDGSVVVAGHTTGDSAPAIVLARLSSNGAFDDDFGDEGRVILPFPGRTIEVFDMTVDSNGRALVVGSENGDFLAARFTTAGTLDPSFSGDGLVGQSFGPDYEEATSVAVQPDGKIVIGGRAFNADRSRASFAGIRLNNDGFLDRSFDDDGIIGASVGRETSIRSVAIEPDGQIAFAGNVALTGRAADVRPLVLHYNEDGSPNASFGDNGVLQLDTGSSLFNSVVVQHNDGKLAMAGNKSNGIQDLWLVARLGKGPFEDGTDGNLYVTGTSDSNHIRLQDDDGRVRVLLDDTYATTRARSTFDRIIIDAAGGHDTITLGTHGPLDLFAGSGNDTVHGSAGSEFIAGGRGNDVLFGNDGGDRFDDGIGDDQVHGGAGEDIIVISSGNDTITGGGEADKITASDSTGNKWINGEGGNDTITGGEGDDVLIGSGGRDRLYGRGGNDRLDGGDRDDFLDGGPHNDLLSGGAGNDHLLGGSGKDKLFGGGGLDLLIANGGDDQLIDIDGNADTLDGGSGSDFAYRDEDLDDLLSIEVIG